MRVPSDWTDYTGLRTHQSQRGRVLTVVIDETGVNRAILLLRRGEGSMSNIPPFPIHYREAPCLVVELGR